MERYLATVTHRGVEWPPFRPDTRPEAMDLVRCMVERIEVHEGKERGKPDVILVGALAQILAFTQHKTTAASFGDGGRVLMVAGARNQRYLHLDYATF